MTLLEACLTFCLLLQECGNNPTENRAIASTLIIRADQNQSTVLAELQKPYQYPIKYSNVLKRASELRFKDYLVKVWAIGRAVRNPLNFTHYHALYVKPDWSKHGRIIGKHKFVYLNKGVS